MNFNIYKVKHSKYTHIVVVRERDKKVEDIVTKLAGEISDGVILLDMKACSKPLYPRFWEVRYENGKLITWKLLTLNKDSLGEGLVTYCDGKHAEETI